MAYDSGGAVSGANSYFALYAAQIAAQGASAQAGRQSRSPLSFAASGPGAVTTGVVSPVGSFRPATPLSSVAWDTINAYVVHATLGALAAAHERRTIPGSADGDGGTGGAGLRVNQNLAAMNAYRNLLETDERMARSLEKLSSGYRINHAADDVAGLAISEGLRSQIGGTKVAVRNAQDGINVVRTADGALERTHLILQRMRDLALRSRDDSADANSRLLLNVEATGLRAELDRIAATTTYNGIRLLDGGFVRKDVQVGYAANDVITVDVASTGAKAVFTAASTIGVDDTMTFTQNGVETTTEALDAANTVALVAWALNDDEYFSARYVAEVEGTSLVVRPLDGSTGLITGQQNGDGTLTQDFALTRTGFGFSGADLGVGEVDLSTKAGALAAIGSVDDAIVTVSLSRANLGALQNRFEHTINHLGMVVGSLSASESRIRDVDSAREMLSFTRSQILSQAGTAMLSQVAQAPRSLLSLLETPAPAGAATAQAASTT